MREGEERKAEIMCAANSNNNTGNELAKSDPAKFRIYDFIMIGIVFAAVLGLGVCFRQDWIRTVPCLGTLVVLMLTAHASRWGYLLGALNSIVYAIGYFQMRVFGQVASALIVSLPIQVFTFFNWSRNKTGKQVKIRALTWKRRWLVLSATVAAWLVSMAVFYLLDDFNAPLSGATFVIGLLSSLLAMFACFESCYINVLNYLITTILNIFLVLESWANITYLLIGIYGMIQGIRSCVIWISLYRVQKSSRAEEKSGVAEGGEGLQ